jgi:hypothetical protein
VVELLILVGMLAVPAVADLLGHRPPSVLGSVIAGCAVPAVLAADALAKLVAARRAQPRADAAAH